jgi:toxin ParE1/3/4
MARNTSVTLGQHFDEFVSEKITQGRFQTVSEVVRAGLRKLEWLSKNPYTGKDRDDIKNGYYCFPEGMHLVFYTMTEYGIDIIGIPHQNMDVINHF